MEIALDSPAVNRLAVSHVVFRHHSNAKAVQIIGKIVVTLNVFCNAVDDLKDRLRLSLRFPAAAVNLPGTLGIEPEVFPHSAHPTTS